MLLTFFVARFSRQQEGCVLIGRGVGHGVGRHGEGRLRHQSGHERNEAPALDGPLGGAVGSRHAAARENKALVT